MEDARLLSGNRRAAGANSEHFAKGDGDRWAVVADVPERQGVTGHNVRYVLIGGLAGAVVGLITVLALYVR